jgi:hypothetical protein
VSVLQTPRRTSALKGEREKENLLKSDVLVRSVVMQIAQKIEHGLAGQLPPTTCRRFLSVETRARPSPLDVIERSTAYRHNCSCGHLSRSSTNIMCHGLMSHIVILYITEMMITYC